LGRIKKGKLVFWRTVGVDQIGKGGAIMFKLKRREWLSGLLATLGGAAFEARSGTAQENGIGAGVVDKPHSLPSMQPSAARGAFRKPLVNHLGYRPHGAKHLVLEELPEAREARVVRMRKKGFDASLTVPLRKAGDDFGSWLVGDFSALIEPGTYRVSVPFQFSAGDRGAADAWPNGVIEAWSYDFVIGEKVWDAALRKMVDYYQVQRCGAGPP
jgi:hypothetical protein